MGWRPVPLRVSVHDWKCCYFEVLLLVKSPEE